MNGLILIILFVSYLTQFLGKVNERFKRSHQISVRLMLSELVSGDLSKIDQKPCKSKLSNFLIMTILQVKLLYKLIQHFKSTAVDKDVSKISWNSRAYKEYKYGHLGCWYYKSTLYKRFLNWNKIFKKIK